MLAYDGRGRSLVGIVIGNTLLGLVTVGFYRFWGKTRLRRYLWSRMRLLGDRLEYAGTGRELFFGFLIALAFLIPLSIVSGLIDNFMTRGTLQHVTLRIGWYLFFVFLIGVAIYRARRYRMTRTVWRGIRFGLTGSSVQYALRVIGYGLLTLLTLGLARPVSDVGLQSYMINNSWFGSGEFRFYGRARDLFGRWVLCWLLMPFTLGLSLIWYAAIRTRYFATHTRFQTLRFAMPVSFGDLAGVLLPYYLAAIVLIGGAVLLGGFVFADADLGSVVKPGTGAGHDFKGMAAGITAFVAAFLLLPALQILLVTHRMMRLVARRLVVEGDTDLDSIVQNVQTGPRTGEGLADALDVAGGGFEVGF